MCIKFTVDMLNSFWSMSHILILQGCYAEILILYIIYDITWFTFETTWNYVNVTSFKNRLFHP